MNMARDEAMLLELEEGRGMPTLRLYGWSQQCLTIGYMQDASRFATGGLPVIRRPTGGRAVLHWQELTYSVVAPIEEEPFCKGLSQTYYSINTIIADALRGLGVDAELSSRSPRADGYRQRASCFHRAWRHEIVLGGRKLSGGAQRRLKRAFLQHGSILLDVDDDGVRRLFGEDAPSTMAALKDFAPVDEGELSLAIAESMERGLQIGLEPLGLTDSELEWEQRLLDGKYRSELWNLKGNCPVAY